MTDSDTYYYNTSYSQLGIYDYHIWAKNAAGQKSSYIYHFYLGENYFDIPLETGWNLITIPTDNGIYASDLAENITGCLSVSKWDQFAQSYYAYFVDGPDSFDYELESGYGYFIETEESSLFSVQISSTPIVSVPIEISWNLIGWFDNEDTTAKSLSENITGCLSVSKWDPVVQSYYAYFVDGPDSFNFNVTCGMGLFVEVYEESMWHGEG